MPEFSNAQAVRDLLRKADLSDCTRRIEASVLPGALLRIGLSKSTSPGSDS